MELPAIERLIRSRYATALRTNSQSTRNQRTRLFAPSTMQTPLIATDMGHAVAPGMQFHQRRERKRSFVYAVCAFRNFTSSWAMVFSSPGFSMKEFMDKASPCSPEERTMEGFPPRRAVVTSRGASLMRAESHLMRKWGTWLAISGVGKEVVTPGIFVTWLEIKSRRRCHSLFSAS